MYSVTLANEDCIFDSRSDFDTLEDAKEWASDRGTKYHVMIADEEIPDGKDKTVADYWVY